MRAETRHYYDEIFKYNCWQQMFSKTEIADLLARVALFAPLDAGGRLSVAEALRETKFDAGQAIFSRGDAGAELYVVTKGVSGFRL